LSIIPTRFSLRGKLLAGSAVLLAFTGAVGAFGINDIKSANHEADLLYSQSVVPLAELGTARAKFNENRAFVNNHMLESTADAKAEVEAKIQKNIATIDSNLADVEPTLSGDAELQDDFTALKAEIATYREARNQVITLSSAGKAQEAYALNKAEAIPASAKVAASFTSLFEAKVAAGKTSHEHIEAAASAATTRAVIIILAAILVGFGMAFWFSQRITKTVNEILSRLQTLRDRCTTDLAHALGRVAQGDLTVEVVPVTPELHRASNDEIGDVAEAVGAIRNHTVASVVAYNEMRAQLSDTGPRWPRRRRPWPPRPSRWRPRRRRPAARCRRSPPR